MFICGYFGQKREEPKMFSLKELKEITEQHQSKSYKPKVDRCHEASLNSPNLKR